MSFVSFYISLINLDAMVPIVWLVMVICTRTYWMFDMDLNRKTETMITVGPY